MTGMTKPASRLALSTIVFLAACGSRSELLSSRPLEGRDAAVDPPLTRPACLDEAALPRGAPRFTIPNIAGHPAVGRDGTIYAPTVTENNGRGLAAIDPCGRVLWRTEGWVGTPSSRTVPYTQLTLPPNKRELVPGVSGIYTKK